MAKTSHFYGEFLTKAKCRLMYLEKTIADSQKERKKEQIQYNTKSLHRRKHFEADQVNC